MTSSPTQQPPQSTRTSPVPAGRARPVRRTAARHRRAQRTVERWLSSITVGRLELTAPNGTRTTFGDRDAPATSITVHNQRFFSDLLHGGSVGVGASYIRSDWDSDNLVTLIQTVIANRSAVRNLTPMAMLRILIDLAIHTARGNRIARAKSNIAAHYDLSNDLYATFLDETMTYSSAYFDDPAMSLADAQHAKYRRLADKARLAPGLHVLEIGCGWGSFAITAARDYGCRVTGITLSEQQATLARQRVEDAGLNDRIDIQLVDYRNVTGTFDRIVSIEMLEAVGHRYLGTYFDTIDRLLTPDGIAAIQVITLPSQREGRYRRRPDFIQRFVFPGGHLPSVMSMSRALAATSDLSIVDVEDLAMHYAETLRRWRSTFEEHLDDVAALGFDREFQRLWVFYLAYCEAAFSTRYIHDLQLVIARSLNTSLGRGPYTERLVHARDEPAAAPSDATDSTVNP
ncbi:MAG: cyclopropane-fatty-acyl-phospholipid synthase family protein [Nitriliruptoraceae bacterium]